MVGRDGTMVGQGGAIPASEKAVNVTARKAGLAGKRKQNTDPRQMSLF